MGREHSWELILDDRSSITTTRTEVGDVSLTIISADGTGELTFKSLKDIQEFMGHVVMAIGGDPLEHTLGPEGATLVSRHVKEVA